MEDITMRNFLFATLVSASLLGVPMLTGCDDKETSTKTQTTVHPDGSTTTDKQTTTTDQNGSSSTTTEHKNTP
jgi:hypothetical protein